MMSGRKRRALGAEHSTGQGMRQKMKLEARALRKHWSYVNHVVAKSNAK